VRKIACRPPWRGAFGAGPGSGEGRELRRFRVGARGRRISIRIPHTSQIGAIFIRIVENRWFGWVFGIATVVFVLGGLMLAAWFTVRQISREVRARRFGAAAATTVALAASGLLLWAGSQVVP